jgi:hypothetical protein
LRLETPGQEGRPYTYTPSSSAAAAVSADAPDDQCDSSSWADDLNYTGTVGWTDDVPEDTDGATYCCYLLGELVTDPNFADLIAWSFNPTAAADQRSTSSPGTCILFTAVLVSEAVRPAQLTTTGHSSPPN